MKILETERLVLRQITLGDAPLILALMNDPAFIRYVADRGLRTEADAAGYIAEKMLPLYEQFGFGPYAVDLKDGGVSIGTCGLIKRDSLPDPDLGYAFRREFWGRGLAYEAAAAVKDYARNALGLRTLIALVSPDNLSSIKLLEKLGLRFEKMIQLPGYEGESRLYVESLESSSELTPKAGSA
ncbi:MAG TPA: GNAT family N-acetyltransferase [Chthoniobacterales bacterium]|nr:GNAT family N-acetyltransferase [Chthoniobacterales bacterium]